MMHLPRSLWRVHWLCDATPSYTTSEHHHHHHTNIIRVLYNEQLQEHWTRSKQRDANATVWQSRQGPRREVRFQVTLEGGYRWRVRDEGRQRVPDASPGYRPFTIAGLYQLVCERLAQGRGWDSNPWPRDQEWRSSHTSVMFMLRNRESNVARLHVGHICYAGSYIASSCKVTGSMYWGMVKTATSQNGDKPKRLQVQSKRINLISSTMDLLVYF